MRSVIIAILSLLVSGCAGHDAGTAIEVTPASKTSRARLRPTVNAVVRSFAQERGFRLQHESSKGNGFQTYAVEPPDQPAATCLYVFPEPDAVTIEINEIGVSHPSHKHLEIQRVLKTRLEAAGLLARRTDPRVVITF